MGSRGSRGSAIAFVALVAGFLGACGPHGIASDAVGGSARGAAGPGGGITVFAAASLRDVFETLEGEWAAAEPEAPLHFAFDGSNVLGTHILEGASADVFVSADGRQVERLVEAGLVSADPVVVAATRIALVVPVDSLAVTGALDLGEPGVRIVAASPAVPVSRYADIVIERLARLSDDPAGFRERVMRNIVSREDNVRAAFAKVELGEGDAAFVYATDVGTSDRVREVALPDGVAATATYVAAAISDRDVAQRFVEWLAGPGPAAVLQAAGFSPAEALALEPGVSA